ncbi:unnamed protein product [Protopolystoma xenopodis]|uniref:Uncharacterized protein n=1 Tax=Protopolystoma xenopodis TaxID=117903 RepID=A0A3S5FCI0_9PLAT|nr:unnamed protein product [Protopolystoma xenopodis]
MLSFLLSHGLRPTGVGPRDLSQAIALVLASPLAQNCEARRRLMTAATEGGYLTSLTSSIGGLGGGGKGGGFAGRSSVSGAGGGGSSQHGNRSTVLHSASGTGFGSLSGFGRLFSAGAGSGTSNGGSLTGSSYALLNGSNSNLLSGIGGVVSGARVGDLGRLAGNQHPQQLPVNLHPLAGGNMGISTSSISLIPHVPLTHCSPALQADAGNGFMENSMTTSCIATSLTGGGVGNELENMMAFGLPQAPWPFRHGWLDGLFALSNAACRYLNTALA